AQVTEVFLQRNRPALVAQVRLVGADAATDLFHRAARLPRPSGPDAFEVDVYDDAPQIEQEGVDFAQRRIRFDHDRGYSPAVSVPPHGKGGLSPPFSHRS